MKNESQYVPATHKRNVCGCALLCQSTAVARCVLHLFLDPSNRHDFSVSEDLNKKNLLLEKNTKEYLKFQLSDFSWLGVRWGERGPYSGLERRAPLSHSRARALMAWCLKGFKWRERDAESGVRINH